MSADIEIQAGDMSLRMDVDDLAGLLWQHLPPGIIDPTSAEAKEMGMARFGIKSTIKTFAPSFIKARTGQDIQIPKDIDTLEWFTALMVSMVVAGLSSRIWRLEVETNGKPFVYRIRGIAPISQEIASAAGAGGAGAAGPA